MQLIVRRKRIRLLPHTIFGIGLALYLLVGSCKDESTGSTESVRSISEAASSGLTNSPEPTTEITLLSSSRQVVGTVRQLVDPNVSAADPNKPPADIKAVEVKWTHPRSTERSAERSRMVRYIRDFYRLTDIKILEAINNVPRHWFVTEAEQRRSYDDMPLPIGHGQTISQPYMVAYMTNLLRLDKNKKVLEVGTGSAYQAAVLTEFTPQVFTIEIVESLAKTAASRLKQHGYNTIKTKTADGYWGWKEQAPFDAIIVTCAANHIPPSLIEQLKPGGRMCIPVGGPLQVQNLMLINKDGEGKITSQSLMPVRFVPLVRKK